MFFLLLFFVRRFFRERELLLPSTAHQSGACRVFVLLLREPMQMLQEECSPVSHLLRHVFGVLLFAWGNRCLLIFAVFFSRSLILTTNGSRFLISLLLESKNLFKIP